MPRFDPGQLADADLSALTDDEFRALCSMVSLDLRAGDGPIPAGLRRDAERVEAEAERRFG